MRSRWAWFSLALLSLVVAAGTLLTLAVSPAPWLDDAVFVFAGIAPTLVGSLLVIRVPGNPVGKLLVLIGAAWLLGDSARAYLWTSLHVDLPWTAAAAWFVPWTAPLAWGLIPILLSVFPSGGVASSWRRWLLGVYGAIVLSLAVGAMFAPWDLGDGYGEYLAGFANPLAIDALRPIFEATPLVDVLSGAAVLGVGLIAIVDLVVRWRRSAGVERLQMRTFALGALVMFLLLIAGSSLVALRLGDQVLENLTTTIAISAPPLALGVAILRFRLYAIDRLISRTVGYAVVAVMLAAVFAAIVVGLPQVLGLPDDSPLLVAGATLAVAALFNPLRSRVQAGVDRRFNRARYDAQQEVERFVDRLRDQVDADAMVEEVVNVVSRTLQPATVSLWLADHIDR